MASTRDSDSSPQWLVAKARYNKHSFFFDTHQIWQTLFPVETPASSTAIH
jgi:hypothetical protein